jgi:WD40 repeat protein
MQPSTIRQWPRRADTLSCVSARFDGFISYSRRDRQQAELLRLALQRIRRPLRQRRSLSIVLDTEVMGPAGSLRRSVQDHIDASAMLIVALSPAASASEWVNEEIDYWLTTRSIEGVLLAWIDGDPVDTELGSLPPMPPALLAAYDEVPIWVDLRDHDRYDLDDPTFRAAVARLAAPMHGMTPEDVASEDLDLYRRGRRLRRLAVAGLTILAVAATVGAVLALRFAQQAQRESELAQANAEEAQANAKIAAAEARTAQSRAHAATSITQLEVDTDVGALLAIEAHNTEPTDEALDALLTAGRWLAAGPERLLRLPPETDAPFRLNATAVSASADVVVASWGSRNQFDRSRPDAMIFVWDGRGAGREAFVIETDSDLRWRDLFLSPSGSTVIASHPEGFEAWDLDTRSRLAAGDEGPARVDLDRSHALLPDDGGTSLVATEGWRVLGTTSGGLGFGGGFLTEDERFAGLVSDGTVELHDLGSANDDPVRIDLAGGRVVDTGFDGSILIQRGAELRVAGPSGEATPIDAGVVPIGAALAPDRSLVVVVEPGGDLRVVDPSDGRELARIEASQLPTLVGRSDPVVWLDLQEVEGELDDGTTSRHPLGGFSVASPDAFDVSNRHPRVLFFDPASGTELFRTEADSWWVPPGTAMIRLSRDSSLSFVDPMGGLIGNRTIDETWPSADGTHYGYAASGAAGVIALSTEPVGATLRDIPLLFADAVDHTSATVDPTSTYAAVGGASGVMVHSLANAEAEGLVVVPPEPIAELLGDVIGDDRVRFLPRAQRWVATTDRTLLVADVDDPDVRRLELPTEVEGIITTPDEDLAVIELDDADPLLVDLESLDAVSLPPTFAPKMLANGAEMGVSFDFSDGPAIHHRSGDTTMVDPIDWEDLEPPTTDSASAPGLALSPDGSLLALSDGAGLIRLIDTATGDPIGELAGPRGVGSVGTGGLEFSPDGRRLAIHGRGLVSVWDLDDRSIVRSWNPRSDRAILSFDPVGSLLMVDDTLWDISTGRAIGASYPGGGARFSSDGEWLTLWSGSDATRWPVGIQSITDTICAFAGRPLTGEEAARFNVEEITACR